jgi:hypothetical protein
MGKKIFYVFGALNADGAASIYDNSDIFSRFRFFYCDILNDLPTSNFQDGDLAIVKEANRFFFSYNSQWIEITRNAELSWPIDSIFQCAVDTDPEKLLGFGKWECVQKEPFYSWQRKG